MLSCFIVKAFSFYNYHVQQYLTQQSMRTNCERGTTHTHPYRLSEWIYSTLLEKESLRRIDGGS